MRHEKRFPTIIGIIFLLCAIVASLYLTKSQTSVRSKASGDCQPTNVQITNITNSSADVSFTTSASCLSSLSIDNQVVEDVRFLNTNQAPSATKIHYFQAKNLKEKNEYSFSLIINGQPISQDKFHFVTSVTPRTALPVSNLAWGRVLNPDKQPTSNAIVYLIIPGAATLSSFVTTNGNWSISLASSFNDRSDSWFIPPADPINEDIIVIADDGSSTQVTNKTNMNNPVPDIIIGQNSLSIPADYQSDTSVNMGDISPVQSQQDINIISPTDGENLNTSSPDFIGTGPINSTIVVEVHSTDPVIGQVVSDSSGSWHWSPPQGLSPGEHTIIAKVNDPVTGLWQSVSKKFTVVIAQSDNASNLAYVASGSATIKPSPSLTPTLTPMFTPSPTESPIMEPTLTPTNTPTVFVRTANPSGPVPPPITGNSFPTFIIFVSALLFTLISFKILM